MQSSICRVQVRLLTCVGCLLSCAQFAAAQITTRESVDARGFEIVQGGFAPAISGDGRHVVFASNDLNLVAGFGNGWPQLFVRDRQTGAVQPVTVDLLGSAVFDSSDTATSSVSADGNLVVFSTRAGNVVAGDTNGGRDVFVRDVAAGVTTRASLANNGAEGNGWSYDAAISADGRWVCFASAASNLVANDTTANAVDFFVRDRLLGTTEIVSTTASGAQASGLYGVPRISVDGNVIAFSSTDGNVVPGDFNGFGDVFVRDLQLGVTELVSVDSNGALSNGNSTASSLSADGRFVVFESFADNLVTGDTNARYDIFVRDRVAGITLRADVDPWSGELQLGSWLNRTAISDDGRFVAFGTTDDLAAVGDVWGFADVFVRDLVLAQTLCASCRFNGEVGSNASYFPSMSADGRFVAFASYAKNLVLGDTTGLQDVFVRDLANTVGPPMVLYGTAKVSSAGCAPSICASGAASVAGPMSLFVTGSSFIDQAPGLLLWSSASASLPFHGGTLSVAAPRVRFAATSSLAPAGTPGCLGRFSVHFDASYLASRNLQAGDDVYAQYIARDPGFAAPNNFALSNGLHFVVQP